MPALSRITTHKLRSIKGVCSLWDGPSPIIRTIARRPNPRLRPFYQRSALLRQQRWTLATLVRQRWLPVRSAVLSPTSRQAVIPIIPVGSSVSRPYQVHFVAKCCTESCQCPGCVVLLPVESTIDDGLETTAQGLEESCNS